MPREIKFIEHNTETCAKENGRETIEIPKISIKGSSGSIMFNAASVRLLDLKADDRIVFFQDSERLKDWYIMKIDKTMLKGFKILQTFKKENASIINNTLMSNTIIARKIITSLFPVDKAKSIVDIQIGIEPMTQQDKKFFSLITLNAKLKERKPKE